MRHPISVNPARLFRAGLVLLCLAGCGIAEEATTRQESLVPSFRLPSPQVVQVAEFRVDPKAVALDGGFVAALGRAMAGRSDSQAAQYAAGQVRQVLSATLIDRIRAMGLDAGHAAPAHPAGAWVRITGSVQAIDQGNSTSRRLLGLRHGGSGVQIVVHVAYLAPGLPPRQIGTIDGEAQNGWAPGMAFDLGFGVATGTILTSAVTSTGTQAATYSHGSASADAVALANQVADDLGGLFARQGWIAASALRPPPLRAPERATVGVPAAVAPTASRR